MFIIAMRFREYLCCKYLILDQKVSLESLIDLMNAKV